MGLQVPQRSPILADHARLTGREGDSWPRRAEGPSRPAMAGRGEPGCTLCAPEAQGWHAGTKLALNWTPLQFKSRCLHQFGPPLLHLSVWS